MAFPLIFEPARGRGRLLLDGGLLGNVPVDLVRRLGACRVVAPDVHKPLRAIPASRVGVDARTFGFSQTRKIIDMGRKATGKNLPAILNLLKG